MPCGRRLSALMAARPHVRNRADEPQRARSAPNAQPPGHACPDFRGLCDRLQLPAEYLPACVTLCAEVSSAVASKLALQRSLPLLSGGVLGGIRPLRSFDQFAVFSDHSTEVPSGIVTGLGFLSSSLIC